MCINAAYKAKGLDVEWDVDTYHKYLQIGGGKERMKQCVAALGASAQRSACARADVARASPSARYFTDNQSALPASARSNVGLDQLVAELHADKTKRFTEFVANGNIAPRPGVAHLMREALDRGVKARATTHRTRAAPC